MNPAVLALEDGSVFEGRSFGAPAERAGEVVFNTAMTGYQEIFTDPSYAGQIVILTNPQIGNYGTSSEDNEAARPYIEGLVVREFSPIASNWRSDEAGADLPGEAEHSGSFGNRHARSGAASAHSRRDARGAFGRGDGRAERWWRRRAPFRRWRDWIWRAASRPPRPMNGRTRWTRARHPS